MSSPLIKINKDETEKVTVSLRQMNTAYWSALKKLAAIAEVTMTEYVERLIAKDVESVSNEG